MTLFKNGRHEAASPVTNVGYDVLKFIALIFLPALGSAYYAAAQIWGLPYAEEVVGTVTIIDGLLGLIVKYLADRYNQSDAKYDGTLELDEQNETMKVEFQDPSKLIGVRTAKEVTFKVHKPS